MKKQIPNIITLMNLICGSVAITFIFKENFTTAWLFVIFAAIFDFFDGFAARALGAYSNIGKELDSLCDVVSFGVAPALAFYEFYSLGNHVCGFLAFVPLLIAAGSAFRLAKFNVDERQQKSFLGLPTPACGLLVMSFVAGGSSTLINTEWFIPTFSLILSVLLISEIPMFSMKKITKSLKIFFAVSAAAVIFEIIDMILMDESICTKAPRCLADILLIYLIINFFTKKHKNETI